jgi:hypothetical protein
VSDGARTTEELLAHAVRQAARIQEALGRATYPELSLVAVGGEASDVVDGGPLFTGRIVAGSTTVLSVHGGMTLRELAEELARKVDAETTRLTTTLGRATVDVGFMLEHKRTLARLEEAGRQLADAWAELGDGPQDGRFSLADRVRALRRSRDWLKGRIVSEARHEDEG